MKPYYDSITLLTAWLVFFVIYKKLLYFLNTYADRHSLQKAFSDRLIYQTVNCPMDI